MLSFDDLKQAYNSLDKEQPTNIWVMDKKKFRVILKRMIKHDKKLLERMKNRLEDNQKTLDNLTQKHKVV